MIISFITMVRTVLVPVLLSVICVRQAAAAPDGPDAPGTGTEVYREIEVEVSQKCDPNLSGTIGTSCRA